MVLLAAVASASLVAGCSQPNAGHPTPQASTNEATAGTSSAATPSENELPLSNFASDPCGLLRADQISSLGQFKAPEKGALEIGVTCKWHALDVLEGASVTVTVPTNGTDFTQAAKNFKDIATVYTEKKVSDLPAFSGDPTDAKGNCTTGVGTPSKSFFLLQVSTENESSPEYTNSCGTSEKIAAFVVKNLKG